MIAKTGGGEGSKVEVILHVRTLRHKSKGIFARRAKEFGLVGYGHTREEADKSLDRVFQRFITELSKRDELEQKLISSGVEWHWEDEVSDDWAAQDTEPEPESLYAYA